MLHPMLINFENEAWGWQTFNTDNSELFTSWNDGAVAQCNKTVIRKKLNDGKCIMIDFRKVSKGQESTFVENLLFNERKQRQIVAQNLSKDSKTKIAKKKADEEKKKQELLAKQKADEEKKQQELLAKQKADEEKKQQELLAKQKADEEKKQQELLAKQKADEEKKQQELLAKQKADEEKKQELLAKQQMREEARIVS
jgi:hypothetical protein